MVVNIVNASCKRHDQLAQEQHDEIVRQIEAGELLVGKGKNQLTNLARPGDTRWGSHHKTLCRLVQMWKPVLKVLENLHNDADNVAQRTTAAGLIKQMESFEFVLILHLMITLLGKTNNLSQCLQLKNQNIVRAVGLIKTTLDDIQNIRQNGWGELFKEVTDFCVKYNIVVPNMEDTRTANGRSRTWGRQLVTYNHHFRNEIFNVLHDQLIVELNNRFAERSTQLLRCIACLDPKNSFANYNEDKLVDLANMYAADFSTYEVTFVLRNQLDSFIQEARVDTHLMNCNDLGHLAINMVTMESAFSAMSIIKTGLRKKMGDDWMNHRMVCYIERDVFVSIGESKIIERFQGYRSRKCLLPRPGRLASSTIEDVVMGGSDQPIL
ncbi:uncharacterized protein [Triticum aestivum]|uniref:uncharacterized protein isoform X2 n=1 Tax=Triticum aestivum TaxID=4565 RepID=UPI001D01EFB7|nr:uncharacterized protein LOC123187167 isoform X2 [Triticum aestivum]